MSSHYAMPFNAFSRPIRVAYPVSTENRAAASLLYLKVHWKKIVVAVFAGVFAGFLTAAANSKAEGPLTRVVYAAAPVPPPGAAGAAALEKGALNQDTAAEVSRLRAENQELQSLVDSLRKQTSHGRTHHARVRRRVRGHAG